jgi:hypothetical protein
VRETTTEPATASGPSTTITGDAQTLLVTEGVAVQVKVCAVPAAGLAKILLSEPPGLAIGKVRLADGSTVLGVLGENALVQGQREITGHAGWRTYMRSKSKE